MTARAIDLATLLAPDEDDLPPARRSRRDWLVDTAFFAVALATGIQSVVTSYHHGLHGALLAVDLVYGMALCLALWWRRRWPFALALAATLPISSFGGPAGGILLFTVAAYRRWQLAFFVAAVGLASLPAERAIHPQGDTLASHYLVGIIGTAVVVGFGMFWRGHRQTQRERLLRIEAQEQLRVEQIRHSERERIAREMHDVLAHRISLLSLHAGALELRTGASSEEVARAAAIIRASAHQALEDLRSVIGLLREPANGDGPQPPQQTLAELPGLLEESRAAGMALNADVRLADLSAVPEPTGRNALRIVQEALTNARKHAQSAPVDLRIDGAPGRELTIEVRNPAPLPAVGTTEIPGSGTGLVGLAERAALSGGHLEHGLDERGEFRLLAWLPWPP